MNGKIRDSPRGRDWHLKIRARDKKNVVNLIEKYICDRQTQNLRLRDPLESSARFRDLDRICRDSQFSKDHSPPLTMAGVNFRFAVLTEEEVMQKLVLSPSLYIIIQLLSPILVDSARGF